MKPFVFARFFVFIATYHLTLADRKLIMSCGNIPGEHDDFSSAIDREVHLNRVLLEELEHRINSEYDCAGVGFTTTASTPIQPAVDLGRLFENGVTSNGIYDMDVHGHKFRGYFEKQGGNTWLFIQKRTRGFLDFYLNWKAYVDGFGNLNDEFWMGLEHQHLITQYRPYILRVDLVDADNRTAYAEYNLFSVGNVSTNYRLEVSGYSGTAGDSLARHNRHGFTTKDRDNDEWSAGNCAREHNGAWWYRSCHLSNLNGLVIGGGQISDRGINWYTWKNSYYSMKSVDMKIRPP